MTIDILASIRAQRGMANATREIQSSFRKLSAGVQGIFDGNTAGVALAESLLSKAGTTDVAVRNTYDGETLSQLRDSTYEALTRVNQDKQAIAMQAANGTLSDSDRAALDEAYQQLNAEEERIIGAARHNGRSVFAQTSLQVGPESGQTLDLGEVDPSSVVSTSDNVLTQSAALTASSNLRDSLNSITAGRAEVGAIQSRLEVTRSNLETSSLNLKEAGGRIRDVDFAEETAKLTRNSLLQQGAQAVFIQANSSAETVLGLLA